MESMRRSEANSSHHPNKVAVNSLPTESNKHSSGSGSSLNNNKLSYNQQQKAAQSQQLKQSHEQQQQSLQKNSSSESSSSSSTTSSSSSSGASTSSESKDTNFEYDDNEWDVGGIGDLIIDLDADIEKSSSTAAAAVVSLNPQSQQSSGQQISANLTGVSSNNSSGGGGSSSTSNKALNVHDKSPSSASSSRSSSSPSSPTTVSSSKSSSLSSLFVPIPLGPSAGQQQSTTHQHQSIQKQRTSSTSPAPFQASASKLNSKLGPSKPSSNLKLQQPALLAQLNSKSASSDHSRFSTSSSTQSSSSNSSISRNYQSSSAANHAIQTDRHGKLLTPSATTMSSQQSAGQGAGKTATKMSIDHQATLDKGLKMKIKRTKPGTKTSEAKHEIVKAEQNGTSANADDNNIPSSNSSTSSSSSSGKKHSQMNSSTVQPIQQPQQPTKRGSSGHRRDKTRDKTPHSRDKSDHGSGSGSSNTNSSSSSSNSSSSSSANSSSQNERSSASCNCSLDMQVNGVQTPCANVSCIRSRTPVVSADTANSNSLSQRISAPSTTSQQAPAANSSSTSNSNSVGLNSNVNASVSLFPNSNSSTNVQTSSSGTPNAPGPPKEKVPSSSSSSSNHHQQQQQSSSTQASNATPSTMPSLQQPSQTLNTSSVGHNNNSSQSNSTGNSSQPQSISATVHHTISVAANCDERSCSPPAKKPKCDPKDMVDICIGTSVGTITEPDCLGPCEPGTSVTLEGIVWHETEGGVLVVNVTWRGKTYVGTLLDCTRHDWAPPRFCDSPTEELDSRTPKGRGKRGRGAALTPDLSNFTETRSSVHSKLRNGAKGRGGRAVTTTGPATSTTTTNSTTTSTATTLPSSNSSSTTSSNTPSTSPTAFLPPRPEKRKSKDESPSPVNGESSAQPPSGPTQSLVNPITGLNVQISTKKCKTASPCAVSPVLLECPEQDCSKKYKHANGLRYHQSHAHGSGSMDEDSLQPPESPRIAPPTTPSPAPATTPQPQTPTTIAAPTQVPSPAPSSPSLIAAPVPSTLTQQTVSATINAAPMPTGGLLTTIPQSVTQNVPQPSTMPNQIPQHAVPGGSITSGISGQALSQHQQQHPMLVGPIPGSGIMGANNQSIPETGQPLLSQQQQQQQVLVANANMANVPPRVEPQIKPSVLRFGSPSDNLSATQSLLSSQGPIRPTPTTATMASNPGPTSNPEGIGHQPAYNPSPASVQQSLSANKPQGYSKQKKNRSKSPVLGEYDNSTSRDNVQSPAYSDISDDSTPVADTEMSDKSQAPKHPDVKKVPEGAPPQIASLGGYGMYPFYPQQQYMVPPEHQGPKPPAPQSSMPPSSPAEYNKSKDPPLDLMTKPVQPNEPPPKESNVPQSPAGPGPQNPNKPMPHFYPYNYMTPGYPYNMEPSFGPISMVSDDNKLSGISNTSHSMKEERSKENPSPNEHGKIPGQMIPTKLMKSEPSVKEIKTEPNTHPMHPKEPPVQSMPSYPGMYQRHSVGVPPQQSQHMSREEDVRRFYMYSDQRRPNLSNNPPPNVPPVNIKEEAPSPSQPPMQHSSAGISQGQAMSQMSQSAQSQSQAAQSQNSSQQQKSVKSSLSSSQTGSSQKATNLVKDTKEDKDVKIKQEGQKPTMETQGPPPPPTSQYFLHPQYLTPNFSFDPGHPMYRNVLMSTSPYNAPPYLSMPRFHAPEDLSRNPGPKALDVLQQAANMQYYGSHKIHELSERALKSPNSNSKASVSSPNVSQQNVANTVSGSNIGGGPGIMQPSGGPGGPLNMQPPTGAMPPGMGAGGGVGIGGPKPDGKPGPDPTNKSSIGGGANDSRSPPPQRHVHTHHHTHVGLGYPMYTAPYGAAVLASQQAAAVAVINPFPPGPTK